MSRAGDNRDIRDRFEEALSEALRFTVGVEEAEVVRDRLRALGLVITSADPIERMNEAYAEIQRLADRRAG